MKNAETEESILMEDSITNFIFQDMSSLLFLPLRRVVITFHMNYAPSQGIKMQWRTWTGLYYSTLPLLKMAPIPWILTIFLKAMQTVSYSLDHFPLQHPSLQ